ncbi:hypothetical protein [Halopiger goleimassiliensis]|uniref:hypothetical protein n=1 Tax=Halopiger goleimassiliensis TaxID=1293048 RepID=UPI00067833AA|nr:hypothetical protein [Halopiger goleimassiliensis]
MGLRERLFGRESGVSTPRDEDAERSRLEHVGFGLPAVDDLLSASTSGVIAGVVFGAMLPTAVFMPTFAELYGATRAIDGWIVHLLHSVGFALLYGIAVEGPWNPYRNLTADPRTGALIGACYGGVLWIVTVAVVMPLWFDALRIGTLPFPYVDQLLLLGLLVYGFLLGTFYPLVSSVDSGSPSRA